MQKIKILPIYPKFPDTFWGFKKALKFIRKKSVMPPTGLLTVMSMIPKDKFEMQKVVDLNLEPLTDWHLQNTDIIFTSTMIIQEESHNEIIERAHFFGKKVVAGGPFPTSYPEKNSKADYIISGEAEMTLHLFLEDLLKGNPKKIYTESDSKDRDFAGLSRLGKILLTNTPLPRWDLVDLNNYSTAAIQFSRGCPFDCDFCDITNLYGRESRTKTSEQMIKELDALVKAKYTGSVFIVDDNFIGNQVSLRELLPIMIKWQQEHDYPFTFFTEASINLAWPENKDILDKMVKAGFNQVFVGIESGDNDVLEKIGKKQNTKHSTLDSVKTLQNAGLEVTAGFIIGADGEKKDIFENLFNLIQEAGIVTSMPGLLMAMKGTRLYQRLKEEGRLRGDSDGNNTHQLAFNFNPLLNEKFLIDGYKDLLKKLYDDKNYYNRCRVLRDNLGPNYLPPRKKDLKGFVYLSRSVIKQLFAKGGFEYSRYLIETAWKKPDYFPEAVSQAIKLYHFKSITNAMLAADAYKPQIENLYKQFLSKAEKIKNKYSHDIEIVREKITKSARRILKQAEKKYYRLHSDFRKNASDPFESLKHRISIVLKEVEIQSTF